MSNHTALFVVGAPGIGKTTAVRLLLGETQFNCVVPGNGKIKWCLSAPYVFAGHYGVGTFDGGDTVPNDGWLPCMEHWAKTYLPDPSYTATIFDGDRFSHGNAVAFLEDKGVRVLCAHLTAPEEVLEVRRNERGSDQNPVWLKGRVSKAANFAARFAPPEQSLFDLLAPSAEEAKENCLTEITAHDKTPSQIAAILKGLLS